MSCDEVEGASGRERTARDKVRSASELELVDEGRNGASTTARSDAEIDTGVGKDSSATSGLVEVIYLRANGCQLVLVSLSHSASAFAMAWPLW